MPFDLAPIPILDQHCHALLRRETPYSLLEFQRFFTESGDETIRAEHVPQTLFFRWAVKELAAFLGCAATPEDSSISAAAVAPAPASTSRRVSSPAMRQIIR